MGLHKKDNMKDMHIWVRETYAVVEPWDTIDGNVCAHDKETGEFIGEWLEGGYFPQRILDAYARAVLREVCGGD